MAARIEDARPRPYGTGKRRLNLSVRGDLIDRARAAGLNLSQVLEDSLSAQLRAAAGRRWQEENRAAIAAYNVRVERDGPWNQDLVRF